jgi:hypothetical protein
MGGKGSGRKPSPCGTPAKYQWHYRRGENCTVCRKALAAYKRERYGYKQRISQRRTQQQKRARTNSLMLQSKLDVGSCFDCGLACTIDNWFVFDWDHRVPADKNFTISELKHHVSAARLMSEIAKCDLVCSNCHRHRTHRQIKDGTVFPYMRPQLEQLTLFAI